MTSMKKTLNISRTYGCLSNVVPYCIESEWDKAFQYIIDLGENDEMPSVLNDDDILEFIQEYHPNSIEAAMFFFGNTDPIEINIVDSLCENCMQIPSSCVCKNY